MHVDQQTLRDLDIFESPHGRGSLFQFLDSARTVGGSHALRRRIATPLSTTVDIRNVQDAIRQILAHRDVFRTLPNQYFITAINHYLALTPPVEGRGRTLFFEGLQLWLGDYRQFSLIIKAACKTVYFLRALDEIVRSIPDARGVLTELLEEVKEHIHSLSLTSLPASRPEKWRWWVILRADQIFRHEQRESLKRLMTLVFEIDALAAMADATHNNDFCMPQVSDGPPFITAEGLFHPQIRAAVANPLAVDQHTRLMFITGPNMAGKSTYLRAVGTAVCLAHAGMGVPASSFSFAPFDGLFTAISLSDDVRNGVSFFQAEARRAREIVLAIANGDRVVAVIDEPFKGTNVRDALDASTQYLTRLAKCPDCVFLVASHLVEIASVLDQSGNTRCYHFEARESAGQLEFDYVLNEGVSSQRLGLRVLEEHGVFDLLESRQRR